MTATILLWFLAAVLVACAWAVASRRHPPPLQLLFAACVLLSPFVALWTMGGLETPFLLAGVTAATLLADRCVTTARRADRFPPTGGPSRRIERLNSISVIRSRSKRS